MSGERPRLPPGQGLLRNPEAWPVVGESAPRDDASPWRIEVGGLVDTPFSLSLDDLATRPRREITIDIHCVTRWSKFDRSFAGVDLLSLVEEARPKPEARFLRFAARSARNHDTTLALDLARDLRPLIATEAEGAPLTTPHGGPVRVVTPGRYFYKSLKWLERIELLAENRLGYWEGGPGYHQSADPWAEERYVTGNIPPDLRERMIARRALGGRDLLGVDFSGEALDGLDGAKATVRDGRFSRASLRRANFAGAQLSNAHFGGAVLVEADFRGADVEGADFAGADLRGADFTGASMFGASFAGAIVDGATRIAPDQIALLTDAEADYLRQALTATP